MWKSSFKVFILLVLFLLSIFSIRAQAEKEKREVIEPIDVIDVFYEDLLSDKSLNECAEIFKDPEGIVNTIEKSELQGVPQKLNANGMFWFYLRKHKNLFLFPNMDPELIGKESGVTYLFSVSGRKQFLFDGVLGIMLSYPLSEGGVKKQVIFYIERNKKPFGNRYLINPFLIMVNGVDFDNSTTSINSANFFKELGFEEKK